LSLETFYPIFKIVVSFLSYQVVPPKQSMERGIGTTSSVPFNELMSYCCRCCCCCCWVERFASAQTNETNMQTNINKNRNRNRNT